MDKQDQEGRDPAAQRAAEEWRRRFGREGHEGSYAQHEDGEGGENKITPPDEPSRTTPSD